MSGPISPLRLVPSKKPHQLTRRGAIIVLAAFLMIFMMAVLALSVDVGYMMTVKSEAKRSTDAAALAGAGVLIEGAESARLQAFEFLARNPVGGRRLDGGGGDGWTENIPGLITQCQGNFEVEVGHWNPVQRVFIPDDYLPSTVCVAYLHEDAPLFFARVLGHNSFDTSAESIARYQPRDIVLVLDFSGSMNDDSELKRIRYDGESVRAGVEANLLEIYEDLGLPTYGNMQFEPQYISSDSNFTVRQTLGLSSIPYPYPSGSWDSYIDYVQENSNVYYAGYRKKYGYMTLINYWLEQKPKYSQTPDLWQVSAQPVTAVKDTVGVFMSYIQEVDCEDRVALAIYNSSSQNALLEHSLTEDFETLEDTVQHRQAGHYDVYTNIGAGVYEARNELQNNARPGSKKMIVLMTDGIANRPGGTSSGQAYALEQAYLAAGQRYPIVTISLGNGADSSLMQQIADTTNGVHFNVPGGDSVADYEEQLLAVFRQIADDRPLVLVK